MAIIIGWRPHVYSWYPHTYPSAVADPGFPQDGSTSPPRGVPTYDFANFSQRLHEIERIWTGGGLVQNFTT